jgi:hypothetical protein
VILHNSLLKSESFKNVVIFLDSLSASGSSRLHLGLLLPIAVLHSGGPDSRNEGQYLYNGI